MRFLKFGVCVLAASAAPGCSGGGSSGDAPDTGPASTATSTATSSSGGGPPGADGGPHTDAGPVPPTTSSLQGVKLRTGGRHISDLVFSVQGSDPEAKTTEIHAQLLDAADSPVAAFDTNWDGVSDSAEQRLHFDASTLGQKTFTQTVTLPGLFARFPTVASAVVSLSDVNGALSAPLTATLTQQSVSVLGEPCDVAQITSVCSDGLSCGGTPGTCLAGVAPSITQGAYYGGTLDSTEIFIGTDPDEDLQTLILAFLDGFGKPTVVDLSGDGVGTPVSQYLLDVRSAAGAAFSFQNNPSPLFASLVPKISVTPEDSSGLKGTPVIVSIAPQVIRTVGQSCDAYGINGCATASLCSPLIVGAANTCRTISSLQAGKCSAAPKPATTGVLAAWGPATGVSLWDPPANCTASSFVGRPEAIVTLTLPSAVSTLTVSTAVPETDFDTVLYVLPGCPTSSAAALGCMDDSPGQGYASTVTLTDVPAGTYSIVIDSANPRGGHFGLLLTTQ